jgi:hypothetical protein
MAGAPLHSIVVTRFWHRVFILSRSSGITVAIGVARSFVLGIEVRLLGGSIYGAGGRYIECSFGILPCQLPEIFACFDFLLGLVRKSSNMWVGKDYWIRGRMSYNKGRGGEKKDE